MSRRSASDRVKAGSSRSARIAGDARRGPGARSIAAAMSRCCDEALDLGPLDGVGELARRQLWRHLEESPRGCRDRDAVDGPHVAR